MVRSVQILRPLRARLLSSAAPAWHPTVDIRGLLSRESQQRETSLLQLKAALLDGGPGYFYASNAEDVLSADYIQRTYEFTRALHALPLEIKRNFTGLGGSSKAGAVYSGSDAGQPELAYDPATQASARSWDYSRLRQDDVCLPQYPQTEPGFKATLDDLYERQNVLAVTLMEAFAEILGLPRNSFSRHFVNGDLGTIRLLYYPGAEDAEDADVGIAPHTDFEAFTLMHQDAPGLQLLPAASPPWVDAPVRDSEFIVILGDVLERFTNGALRATPHRVIRRAAPRMSIIRFNAVAPETVIEPLPQFITAERPRAYSRCTMRQHMDTTIHNLKLGLGSWDAAAGVSSSAHYRYEE